MCLSIIAGILKMAAHLLWDNCPPILLSAAHSVTVAAKQSPQPEASRRAVIGFLHTVIYITLYLDLAILAAVLSVGSRIGRLGLRCPNVLIECTSAGSHAPFDSAANLAVFVAAAVLFMVALVPMTRVSLVTGITSGIWFAVDYFLQWLTVRSVSAAEAEGRPEAPAGPRRRRAVGLTPHLLQIHTSLCAAQASLYHAASADSAAIDTAAAAVSWALLVLPAALHPAIRHARAWHSSVADWGRSATKTARGLCLAAAHPVAAVADVMAAVFSPRAALFAASFAALFAASFAGAAAAPMVPGPAPALNEICSSGLAAACILLGVAVLVGDQSS